MPKGASSTAADLCWQDPLTPLSIWRTRAGKRDVYRLSFGSEIVVDIEPDRRIVVRHEPGFSRTSIDHFLADQVQPRLLAHDGAFVIHAGAIRIGSMAVMLLGKSGRGKSTLTASFDRAGHALLGDDAMIVSIRDGVCHVRAVYPSLRLFPDSIEALMPGEPTAGAVAHYTSKERIDVAADRDGNDDLVPVRAIMAIGEPKGEAISIHPMTKTEMCMALVESSFALNPRDTQRSRVRLDSASRVASVIPSFEIRYPRDFASLPAVRQTILDHVSALEPA